MDAALSGQMEHLTEKVRYHARNGETCAAAWTAWATLSGLYLLFYASRSSVFRLMNIISPPPSCRPSAGCTRPRT